ncbi:MAG: SapC family protein [Colwellia sp.]|nr:SapC family protein [Colwellia sp.]MCW8866288.1 SapC family protein [Colwellia sp.]MCW9081502.1 SapC family protein [Colwellia sp.]
MTQLVVIDNKNHLKLKIDSNKAEQHGANLHLVPAVMSEFINMAIQYPLVITKNADTGQFVIAAMLGFEAGENLFWRKEQWQGLYLPLQIRRQPFFVSSAENSSEEGDYVVCFDSDSPTISPKSGQAIFEDNGEESEYFQKAKSCLAQLLKGEIDNKRLLANLEELELLQVMKMEITFANQQTTTLNGLYTIDQDKLANLSADRIAKLHSEGLLQAIYTLITSMGQMHHLIDLKNKKCDC